MGDLTRIGTTVKGKAAYLDPRAAKAWDGAVDLIKARTGFDLSRRILQALGSATASAGVHEAPGVCVDIRVWGMTADEIEEVVALLRECGFAATWYRDWDGNQHIHAATDIGTWTPALYQIKAVKRGYDGTGARGEGRRDPHPAPSAWRTAQTGAAWAATQLGDEIDMATLDELRKIVREETRKTITDDKLVTVGTGKWTTAHVLDRQRRQGDELIARVRGLEAALRAVGAQSGIDVQAVYDAAYKGAQQGVDDEIDGATVTLEA